MANNYKSFPVRSTTGYPSPSGGFYCKFPQKLKSLSLEQKADVSSTLMILENGLQKSSDRLRPPSVATESETLRVNREFISHRFKSAEFAESIKAPQSLQSSFQIKKPVILKGNQRNVATQVEEEPNLRLEFTDMKEYRNWTADNVDPYIKNMRKAILANKPKNLEAYCAAYCIAIANGSPIPQTSDPNPPPDPFANRTNSVSVQNSLIRAQAVDAKLDTREA